MFGGTVFLNLVTRYGLRSRFGQFTVIKQLSKARDGLDTQFFSKPICDASNKE